MRSRMTVTSLTRATLEQTKENVQRLPLHPTGSIPFPGIAKEPAVGAAEHHHPLARRIIRHRMFVTCRGAGRGTLPPDRSVPVPSVGGNTDLETSPGKQHDSSPE